MAAISAWRAGDEHEKERGMAIVTNNARGGMVDIHDRRPVVLSVEGAQAWVDPTTTAAQAREILHTPVAETAFAWHRVTPAMGNSRYQIPDAIAAID